MIIVLAWVIDDIEVVRVGRTDLGERPTLRSVRLPRACVWLNEGTLSDVAKAQAYAKMCEYPTTVFIYEPSWQAGKLVPDPDPIGRAKREIMILANTKT